MNKSWDKLISSVLDPDDIKIYEWIIGAIAFGRTDINKTIVLFGPPRSGKSTITKVLLWTLGYDLPIPVVHDGPVKTISDGFFILETNYERDMIPDDPRVLAIEAHGYEDGRKLLPMDYILLGRYFEHNHWYVLNKCLKTYLELGENYIS